MYYDTKLEVLRDIFGTRDVSLAADSLTVDGQSYHIVDDVIVLLEPSEYPRRLRERLLDPYGEPSREVKAFAEGIQFGFGEEWTAFPKVLPEHEREHHSYFDLVDLTALSNARVCDLGCGIGRWSRFLSERCREVILVDFSDAIFVARRNLEGAENALFFMGDLTRLPFRNDFADFVVCLGVLHHLPVPALAVLRELAPMAPRHLVYLYYALDNRPCYFWLLLRMITGVRLTVSRVRNPVFRRVFTWLTALSVYLPLVGVGRALDVFGRGRYVPLYEMYSGRSLERVRQDVYDRFFTGIEQRHTRLQIEELRDTFSGVCVSDSMPYWHFLCER